MQKTISPHLPSGAYGNNQGAILTIHPWKTAQHHHATSLLSINFLTTKESHVLPPTAPQRDTGQTRRRASRQPEANRRGRQARVAHSIQERRVSTRAAARPKQTTLSSRRSMRSVHDGGFRRKLARDISSTPQIHSAP